MKHNFPVQDSTLSPEAMAAFLVSAYELPAETGCTFFRKGICDTYHVIAGREAFYLKVYRNGRRTLTDVSEEVRLLLHLESDGVPVSVPVARSDGEYVNQIDAPEGKRYSVLFRAAAGEQGDRGDLGRIKAFGQTVGRMHESCDSFKLPYRRSPLDMGHMLDANMSAISEIMPHRPAELSLIRSVADECKRIPLLMTRKSPEFGICHGDLHGGDVAYDREDCPTLFDFDSSGCGLRALDIGVFPASVDWMSFSDETDRIRRQRLDVFLDGYTRVRDLSADEISAVHMTAPIRHIYLMGFVLRHTVLWKGRHWVDDGFIDWHMDWFKEWRRRSEST